MFNSVTSQMPPALVHLLMSTPPLTFCMCAGLVVLHVLSALPPSWPGAVPRQCYHPTSLLLDTHNDTVGALHRAAAFLTAPLFHHDILHLLFNVMATHSTAAALENTLGSTPLTFLVGALLLATQFLLTATATVVAGFFAHTCVLGFSAVLFGLIAVECFGERPRARYSLWGCLAVPAKYLPMGLLLFSALLFPGSSFIAHLAGLACGVAVARMPRSVLLRADPLTPKSIINHLTVFRPPLAGEWGIAEQHQHGGGGDVFSEGSSSGAGASGMPPLPAVPSVGGLAAGMGFGAAEPKDAFPGQGRTLGGGSAPPDSTVAERGAGPHLV
jgi:membrane associated rhomboid family serine protease